MPKLSHFGLINLGQQLGYPLDKYGLCQGFSCMLMQAIFAEIEKIFFYAKEKDISLISLISVETIDKARHWSSCKPSTSNNNRFFQADRSLEDLKDFVQQQLSAENNGCTLF